MRIQYWELKNIFGQDYRDDTGKAGKNSSTVHFDKDDSIKLNAYFFNDFSLATTKLSFE